MTNPTWQRMRSGDLALRLPGERWAVAFVWRTREMGYAYAANGAPTHYTPSLLKAKDGAAHQWRIRTGQYR